MRLLLVFVLFSVVNGAYGQNKESIIDSLKRSVWTVESDSEIVKAYVHIANEFRDIDNDSALWYSNLALELADEIGSKRLIAAAFNSLGTVHKMYSDYEKAKEFYFKAMSISKAENDSSGMSSCYNNLGSLYDDIGNYNLALEYNLKSLAIDEALGDSISLIMSYNNVGLIHYRLKTYDLALEFYEKSLNLREKYGDYEDKALAYNNIGILYYYMEDYEKVLEYFEKALEIWEEVGNIRQMSLPLFNLGQLYYELGLYKNALNYMERALEISDELGDEYGKIITLNMIGHIYLDWKHYDKAKEYMFKSLGMADSLNSEADVVSGYLSISEFYEKTGNLSAALEYHKLYHSAYDTIYNYQKSQQIAEMQTKYEADKRKKEIELLNNRDELKSAQLNKQKLVISIFIGGFILIIVVVILLVRQSQLRKRANKLLAEKNTEIIQQKEEIEAQRDEIETQRDMATSQRDLIADQKQEITDSIVYAKQIQNALLPERKAFEEYFKDHLIINIPRDIVSGDFYYINKRKEKIFVAVADCTGHGVPGAFMSMLGYSFINELISKNLDLSAADILGLLRNKVIGSLHQTEEIGGNQDGMDLSFCIIDKTQMKIEYSGANNPMYLIRDGKFTEYKADKMPVGIHRNLDKAFTNNIIELKHGDKVYLFTDGYADQFGGKGGKKYLYKRFKEKLTDISGENFVTQKNVLVEEYRIWKGGFDQVDDILIVGFEV